MDLLGLLNGVTKVARQSAKRVAVAGSGSSAPRGNLIRPDDGEERLEAERRRLFLGQTVGRGEQEIEGKRETTSTVVGESGKRGGDDGRASERVSDRGDDRDVETVRRRETVGSGGGGGGQAGKTASSAPLETNPLDFPDFDEGLVARGQERASTPEARVKLRSSKVPSSRLGRIFHYGGLGLGLGFGAAGEAIRRAGGGGEPSTSSLFMSEGNISRLVDKLTRMRGAALKLGQFLSIQDAKFLPPQIEQIMLRVQNSADYMPQWQMERVISSELGPGWRTEFSDFNPVPMASASIGQVHEATVASTGLKVAVKIQFPGVAQSIGSDLDNLRLLVSASRLLPKGLYLDNTIKVMRRELEGECDYIREAESIERFGRLLQDDPHFTVPKVVKALSTRSVLTLEMMQGTPLTKVDHFPQNLKNRIGESILKLCLRELFHFRFMQTDPNWTNFLFNTRTKRIELLDFGASREYSREFIADYLRVLRSAIAGNLDDCVRVSKKIGYLTGDESSAMVEAHVSSMLALAEPFRPDAPSPYPFARQTITDRVKAQIPVMLRERLKPPPDETYSLNRKLSGSFLLCARLKAEVPCREMLNEVLEADRDSERSNGSLEAGSRG